MGFNYMVLQNRLGMGGLFLNFTFKNPTKLPLEGCSYKNTHSKKNCNGTFSNKIILYYFFLNYHKNLGSGIQMVGKPKILADNPKCRAWLSAG